MIKKLELGIVLSELRSGNSNEIRPQERLEAAEWADKIGVEYLALPDLVARPLPRFDCLTFMAALAVRTQRIGLVPHVYETSLRHPIELARRILTIDHLSQGRFVFAAGVGGGAASAGGVKGAPGAESELHFKEFMDVGIRRQERGGRTNEILECLKLLWTQPSATFHGKYFNFDNVVLEPKPFQKPHPPIWIGGNSEASIQRVARFGTGWVPSVELTSVMFGSFPAALGRLREVMKEHGRDGEPVHISVCVKTNINPDANAARAEGARFWAAQLGAIEGGMSFDVKEKFGVYGTPEALLDRLLELKAMGAHSVVLHLHSFDLKSQLRRLEEKVLHHL